MDCEAGSRPASPDWNAPMPGEWANAVPDDGMCHFELKAALLLAGREKFDRSNCTCPIRELTEAFFLKKGFSPVSGRNGKNSRLDTAGQKDRRLP